ncbi:MAG: DUF4339 domain-containing protein [Pirellulaceae bacterium]|nr:DUF4339 domain-containing protein [Pirellulaceae bacterium]
MSVVYERIYIRFKGRVLGPLAHEKVVELVARGQITRDQDMSSDAVNWTKASEFTTFFPPVQTTSVKANPVAVQPVTPAYESWFVNVDDQADKAFDEPQIKQMIAAGTIQPSTQMWNQELGAWQDAVLIRPQWFMGTNQVSNPSGATGPSETGEVTVQSIGQLLLSARNWLNFLSILGLIVSTITLFVITGLFLYAVVSELNVPVKLAAVIAAGGQLLSFAVGLYFFVRLNKYAGLLTAIKFRNEAAEVNAAVVGQRHLWPTLTLACLLWTIATLVGMLALIVAWQLQPKGDDEQFTYAPSSLLVKPGTI